MRIFVTACAVAGVLALGANAASAQSSAYCHDHALSIANQYANPVAGAVGGAVVGGVAGGILGKILGKGNSGVGLGIGLGAGTGAVLGGSKAKKTHDAIYRDEYYKCMNQAIPTTVYYDVPPAGSAEWNYFCSLKYKSFHAVDGTFQPLPAYPGGPLPPRRICVLP
jgi:hypothetical protein